MDERYILGTWGIAGRSLQDGRALGYGHVTDAEAAAVLDEAWRLGLRTVDVAATYGGGRVIERLKTWQAKRGKDWAVVAKCGRPVRDGAPTSDLSDASIGSELELFQAELGDPVVVLIKDPPAQALADGTANALRQRIASRCQSIRTGFATHLVDIPGLVYEGAPGIAQIEYNGVNYRLAAQVARQFKRVGWTVWAMQPLAYGWLGRSPQEAYPWGTDDFRSALPAEVKQRLCLMALAFHSRLAKWTKIHGNAATSIAFILANPNIDRVVVGPRRTDQLASTVAAFELSRTASFRSDVQELLEGM